jgi:hypothetical protein
MVEEASSKCSENPDMLDTLSQNGGRNRGKHTPQRDISLRTTVTFSFLWYNYPLPRRSSEKLKLKLRILREKKIRNVSKETQILKRNLDIL